MRPGERVILVGGFAEIVELCELVGISLVGIIDSKLEGTYGAYRVLGTDDEATEILAQHPGVSVHVTPDSPAVRRKVTEHYLRLGAQIVSLVHPSAIIAPSASLGDGCVVQAAANVSANSRLGRGVKINTCANVTHDVVIHDFVTVAPNACILGNVQIGAGAYIGGNATILPRISIGEGAIVGAGSVVTQPVPPNATVYGNPARPP